MSNEIKGYFVRALSLDDNDLLIIKFTISENNIGKIQLSNFIKNYSKKYQEQLKKLLLIIEEYECEFFIVPKQNTKPNV
jgi:hypothetical protein